MPKRGILGIFLAQADLFRQDALDVLSLRVLRMPQYLSLVAKLDRSRIGDARPYAENFGIIVAKQLDVMPHFGSRPHEAHVAHQHVDQLRQFVDLRRPQDSTDFRDPRIGAEGDKAAAFGGVPHHRAELVDLKRTEAAADPLLTKEDRSPRSEPHRQCHDQQQGRQHQHCNRGRHKIKESLDHGCECSSSAKWERTQRRPRGCDGAQETRQPRGDIPNHS